MPNADFQPVSGFDLPRFAGVPTFMRLPHLTPEDALYKEVDIGLIGVPWDGGTSNRPGARHGPRQLRDLVDHDPGGTSNQRNSAFRGGKLCRSWRCIAQSLRFDGKPEPHRQPSSSGFATMASSR